MPAWREYEQEIYERLRSKVEEGATVEFDVKLPGALSGTDRQIDVLVEGMFAGQALPQPLRLAVDCKCWSSKVDVGDMDKFLGIVNDVGADLGLMVTTIGYSRAAEQRAATARGIQVDVVTFEELSAWGPDVEMCRICNWGETESDNMPGMMYLERFAPDGEIWPERIFVGQCDRCQSLHFRCTCGTVTGVMDDGPSEEQGCMGCGSPYLVAAIELDRDALPINESPHERLQVGSEKT